MFSYPSSLAISGRLSFVVSSNDCASPRGGLTQLSGLNMKNSSSHLRVTFPMWQGGNDSAYKFAAELLTWLAPIRRLQK